MTVEQAIAIMPSSAEIARTDPAATFQPSGHIGHRFQILGRLGPPDSDDLRFRVSDGENLIGRAEVEILYEEDEAASSQVDTALVLHAKLADHAGVVGLRGFGLINTGDGKHRWKATDFPTRGTLKDYMENEPPNDEVAKNVASSILPVLEDMHELGFVHTEIENPENILNMSLGPHNMDWVLKGFDKARALPGSKAEELVKRLSSGQIQGQEPLLLESRNDRLPAHPYSDNELVVADMSDLRSLIGQVATGRPHNA